MSFRGPYRKMDTDETVGSDEEPMGREREIEVTGSFIEKHQMTWPCAFSRRSVFNPEYTITGIPATVILDRRGRIRFIQCVRVSEQQTRRIISGLISDDRD